MALGRDIQTKNLLVPYFASAELDRLRRHFEKVELRVGQEIYRLNSRVRQIYFPDRGLISLVKTMEDGRTAEIGVIGTDGLTGVNSLLGIENAAFETVVQIPGNAHRISVDVLRKAMEQHESVRTLLMRYAHFMHMAMAQTAACHRLHALQERCCRWLLVAHDNAQSDAFPLTHEFFAILLGVGRSYVSATATELRRAGLIRYKRGLVTITDRVGLEAAACECYGALRAEFRRLFH